MAYFPDSLNKSYTSAIVNSLLEEMLEAYSPPPSPRALLCPLIFLGLPILRMLAVSTPAGLAKAPKAAANAEAGDGVAVPKAFGAGARQD